MKELWLALLFTLIVAYSGAFVVVPRVNVRVPAVATDPSWRSSVVVLHDTTQDDIIDVEVTSKESAEVEQLVHDDEWVAFAMKMAERVKEVKNASIEKISKGKEKISQSKAGQKAKDIDARVKEEVAKLRGKEEYEFGDLIKAMDEIAKDKVCEITGKEEYEVGDLTSEVHKRVKAEAVAMTGKEDFELTDLKVAINDRVAKRVGGFKEKGLKKISEIKQVVVEDREEWAKKKFGEEKVEHVKARIETFKEEGRKKIGDAREKVRDKIGKFMENVAKTSSETSE